MASHLMILQNQPTKIICFILPYASTGAEIVSGLLVTKSVESEIVTKPSTGLQFILKLPSAAEITSIYSMYGSMTQKKR